MRPIALTLRPRAAAILAVALAATALLAAEAGAKTYGPPSNKIYNGTSDLGSQREYFDYTEEVGRHVPVMQAFEHWGAKLSELNEPKRRWRRTETRGMLSLSTSPCYGCAEVISPRAIAKGAGDTFVLRLNRFLVDWGRPTYVRLLPEMNGHWNPYAAFNSDGSSRGPDHKTKQFRRAWKRIVTIVRGGRRGKINRKLRKLGLPKMKRGHGGVPKHLKRPKVAFAWVPQTHGSPQTHANRPAAYWPGARYVDWVGADIYAKFPNFAGLERFYRDRRRFPFMVGEWAPWDRDDPGFVNSLYEWAESHRRVRMLVYFQGFGNNNPFMLQRYPSAAAALRGQLDNKRYSRYAPDSKLPGGRKTNPNGGGIAPG